VRHGHSLEPHKGIDLEQMICSDKLPFSCQSDFSQ
jgi:hypothetical protein